MGPSDGSGKARSPRFSLKARLTMFYGGLFLLSGTVLLAINYGLVRANLPPVRYPEATSVVPDVDGSVEVTAPVAPGTTTGSVQFGIVEYRSSVLNTLLVQSVVAIVLTSVLALALGWVAARRVLRPVHDITATAKRLSADTLGARRLAMTGPRDELTELADTFDEMLDRLAASFDSQRRFVANASHELRTPLAAQRTLVEVAMAAPNADPALRQLGDRLLILNGRSEQLIDGLLVLARSDRGLPLQLEVRLDSIVREVLNQQRAEAADISIHADLAPRTVVGDRVLLERLVTNLVQNAIRHNVRGGQVWLRVADSPALEVRNTGPVVPNAEVPGLFEPFRRLGGDRTGSQRGVGLGLSIVASVVKAHGGAVHAMSPAEGGLTVTVTLPPAAVQSPSGPNR
jgi:signal transduction histidine kinase